MSQFLNYNGKVTPQAKANAAVTRCRLYGVNSSGKAIPADNTTGPVVAIGAAAESVAANAPVAFVKNAIIQTTAADREGGTNFTVGAPVYVGTAGKVTSTKPTAASAMVQAVGTALTTDTYELFVKPGSNAVGAALAAIGTTSNLVGVDGAGSNAAPLAGTESRLDVIEAKVDAVIARLVTAGIIAP